MARRTRLQQETEVEPDDVMSWLSGENRASQQGLDVFEASGTGSDAFGGSGSSDVFEAAETSNPNSDKTYEQILEESAADQEVFTATCEWSTPSNENSSTTPEEVTDASCEWAKQKEDIVSGAVVAATSPTGTIPEHQQDEEDLEASSEESSFDDEESSYDSDSYYDEKEKCRINKKWAIFWCLFVVVIVAITIPVFVLKGKDDDGDDTQTLRELLSTVALRGGDEFDDKNSYHWQSLVWLSENLFLDQYSDEQKIQRWILACIYYSTSTEESLFVRWLTNEEECTWVGVTCDGTFTSVVGIDLRQNSLVGVFPPEISIENFSSELKVLDVNGNSLSNNGDEGHAFFEKLTNLENLHIGYNDLVYNNGIPSQFRRLSNLVELDVSYNMYSGALLGSVFQNMTSLNDLRLGGNEYNSSIPIEVGELPNLEYLHVENASLTGDLSFMEPMDKIFEMWIDNNPNLGGVVPTFLGDLSSLASLSLTECGFVGSLPTELGKITNMQLMWFYANDITGTVPSELGNLKVMRRLEVNNTRITGTMPEEICALRNSTIGRLDTLTADCLSEMECNCCTYCE